MNITNDRRECPAISDIYGKSHDFLVTPFTFSDWGARVVAGALAEWIDNVMATIDRWEPYLRDIGRTEEADILAQDKISLDACHYDLVKIAECEDGATLEYKARCLERYEMN